MKAQHPYRQGDILLIPITAMPRNLKPIDRVNGRIILAEGEVTGHHHAIADDAATLFCSADLSEMADRFLQVDAEVAIRHEEHDTVTLPAGGYILRRQREYTAAAPRRVAD
jgi:hypothetical protein